MLKDVLLYHLRHEFAFAFETQDEPPEPGDTVTLSIDGQPVSFVVAWVQHHRRMLTMNPIKMVVSYTVMVKAAPD